MHPLVYYVLAVIFLQLSVSVLHTNLIERNVFLHFHAEFAYFYYASFVNLSCHPLNLSFESN
jgi:hypothetical protein